MTRREKIKEAIVIVIAIPCVAFGFLVALQLGFGMPILW